MTDIEIGNKALKSYYSHMRSTYPTFKYSESEFFAIIAKIKGGKALADGLGLGIREAGLTDRQVSNSMLNLARGGGGKIPASFMDFFNYLINESRNISYMDAALFVVKESAKDIAGAAEKVGSQIIFTGKILNFLLPAVALFFVFYWVNKSTQGQLAKSFKGLK